MLPGRDGLSVLKEARAMGWQGAVLMLTARDQVGDRVAALDAGADDYLIKPFALDEMLARLRALARRPVDAIPSILAAGELELDPRSRVARWQGRNLELTPKEFALLELLLRHRGRVFSRTQIFDRLYDGGSHVSDKVVEVIVSTLRTKLAQAGIGDLIRTRRGFGYVFE
jgi:DNA-binding response OmpR family regulator